MRILLVLVLWAFQVEAQVRDDISRQLNDNSIGGRTEVEGKTARMAKPGHISGLIIHISDGNVHEQLGISPSDKIVAYNGEELKSPEQALDAWGRSAKIGRHSMQIEQDGRLKTLKYEVRR